MSVGDIVDSVADIGGSLVDSAVDVGSSLSDLGTEFLDAAGDWGGDFLDTASSFGGDIYGSVTSFAGDSSFFNTNFLGDIVGSGITTVSDFASNITGSSTFNSIGNFAAKAVNSVAASLPSIAVSSIVGPGFSLPGLVNPSVASIASPSILGSLGSVVSIPGLGSTTGYGTTPSTGFSLPGLSTPGFGSNTGYGVSTPGFSGPTNTGSLLNSALSFVTGSSSAQAAVPNSAIRYSAQPTSVTTSSLTQQINAVAQANGVDPNAPLTAEQQEIYNIGQRVNNTQPGAVDANAIPTANAFVETEGGLYVLPEDVPNERTDEFKEIYNPETGTWDVYNLTTDQTVATGLNEQDAIIAAQDFGVGEGAIELNANPQSIVVTGTAYDDEGNLLPGYQLDENNDPVFVGFGSPTTQGTGTSYYNQGSGTLIDAISQGATSTVNSITQGLLNQARQQQTVRDQRQNKAQSSDWRVRLRLAPNSNYLYNDPQCGPVLWPLRSTDGVIFPYTPSIDTAYKAEYETYNLTHSNYRGYFYKGSYVDAINIRATFTAQDTSEANYLLGVIHFFRSATKMFYGQDAQRGAPPPLVYLNGLGDYQFNEHPCVISQFNYNLPADVDYIRAQSGGANGTNLQTQRTRQTIAGNPLSYALQRLATVGLSKGALDNRLAQNTLGLDNPTYVPTKMEISLTLFPIQSREQVSKQFSVKNFANGNLLKGGFW
jgi:hypothetical protein